MNEEKDFLISSSKNKDSSGNFVSLRKIEYRIDIDAFQVPRNPSLRLCTRAGVTGSRRKKRRKSNVPTWLSTALALRKKHSPATSVPPVRVKRPCPFPSPSSSPCCASVIRARSRASGCRSSAAPSWPQAWNGGIRKRVTVTGLYHWSVKIVSLQSSPNE